MINYVLIITESIMIVLDVIWVIFAYVLLGGLFWGADLAEGLQQRSGIS